MSGEITKLESPIDVMYLIHKALTAEAEKVQRMIEEFDLDGSRMTFRPVFNRWATTLMYHADIEDQYMTAPLTDFQPARDNEAEHAELGRLGEELAAYLDKRETEGMEEHVKAAVIALHEQQHVELLEKLQDVLDMFNNEIGRNRIIARTQRHLYGKVVALRICQDDHLETEEAFVLPKVRERMSEAEQLKLVKRLLIDEESDNPNWILNWLTGVLTPGERGLLKELEARFESLSSY